MKKIILTILAIFLVACAPQTTQPEPTINETPFEPPSGKLPGAKVSYENATLSYSIPVSKPTPCYEVKTDMLVMESYPVQLRLNIEITPPQGDVFCAQVISEQMVEGTFEIDHKPGAFSAYINGEKTFTPEIN